MPEYQHTHQHKANGQFGKQSQVRVKQINEQANDAYLLHIHSTPQ
jgi:hypothetical protein